MYAADRPRAEMTPIQIVVGGTVILFAIGSVFIYELCSGTGTTDAGTPPSPHGTDSRDGRR